VTPLALARMTLTIANGGMIVQPYIVAAVQTPDGRILRTGNGRELGRAISAATAANVAGMMAGVVEQGTGRAAALRSVRVAGKTGSAENPHGEAHAWFWPSRPRTVRAWW